MTIKTNKYSTNSSNFQAMETKHAYLVQEIFTDYKLKAPSHIMQNINCTYVRNIDVIRISTYRYAQEHLT